MTATCSTPLPYQASPRALARASVAALAGAAAVLVLFVLPAEWGIDPTGAGRALGLTRMAGGAEADEADSPEVAAPSASDAVQIPAQTKDNIEAKTAWRSDEKTLTLAPHTGVEVKARMVKGDHLIFRWSSTGPVRMDMHGEPTGGKEGEFSTYWKQKNLTEARGSFTAPYQGTHGWYWRNSGDKPVTLKLNAEGFYEALFEPPAE